MEGLNNLMYGIGYTLLVSLVIMLLWNAILPDVLNVTTITYWQAIGIKVIFNLLFNQYNKEILEKDDENE